MKKVLFLCSTTAIMTACTEPKQSLNFFSDGYPSGTLPEIIDPADTLFCASVIDTITSASIQGYDDICYDQSHDCYHVDIPLSSQHLYREEDQAFIVLHPKALYGGTVSVTRDTPPRGSIYFVAIIERKGNLCNFK
jgi:hypothetical protein